MKRALKAADDFVNVLVRYIRYFLLVIDGEKGDACICGFNNDIQSDDTKPSSLASTFALDTKTNFAFAAP